jgi:hypothetical protein
MKLLEAAISGQLFDDGMVVPAEAQAFLLKASLMIASATVLAPVMLNVMLKSFPCKHSEYLGFHFDEVINEANIKVTEIISIENTGELEGRFSWLLRMFSGFNLLKNAIDLTEKSGNTVTAHKLKNILIRLNLLLGIVEAVRFEEDAIALSHHVEKKLDNCLQIFCDFGVLPPDLLADAMARSLKANNQIPDNPDSWEQIAEIAYSLWDQAEELAVKARKADRFAEMFSIAQSSLPYYWASVNLFWDAMARYKTLKNSDPIDLLRDFGIVEEYRVGVLELLSQFGHHLISRPCHFLISNQGETLREGMRKALLAARAQISIYPEKLRPYWNNAVSHVGETRQITDISECIFISIDLQQYMEQNFPLAFADPEVASVALKLYKETWGGSSLDLKSGWYRDLFDSSKDLLTDHPVSFPAGKYTHKSIREGELLNLLLSS